MIKYANAASSYKLFAESENECVEEKKLVTQCTVNVKHLYAYKASIYECIKGYALCYCITCHNAILFYIFIRSHLRVRLVA